MDHRLPLGRRPEDPAAARRVCPLVQVGGIPIDPERRDVESARAGNMCAVHQDRDPARVTFGRDRRHGQHERGLRGDMIDDDELGVRGERADDRLHDVAGVAHGVLDVDRSKHRVTLVTDGAGRERDRAVRQIGRHDFIAGAKRERSEYRVHAGRDVGDEHEIVGARTEERGHLVAGFAQARHGAPGHRMMPV